MSRYRRGISRIALFVALAVGLTLGAPALPAVAASVPCQNDRMCTVPLKFYGGSVQHHPRVYLIFWGSRWASDGTGIAAAVENLFAGLGGTSLNNILSQYGDGTDFVHNDVYLAGQYHMEDPAHDPGAVVGTLDAGGMINYARAQNPSWTNTPDTQFIILPQSGTYASPSPPSASCGFHSTVSGYVFAFVDYPYPQSQTNQICRDADDPVGEVTSTAFHEYAEAATDPTANAGWHTQDSDWQEIADLCSGEGFSPYQPSPDTTWGWSGLGEVQLLWDNSTGSCASYHGEDGFTPVGLPVHTIYAPFQAPYDAMWVAKGYGLPDVGYPTAEQAPFAGGTRQLFSAGAMYSSGGMTHEVHGAIYGLYSSKYAPNLTGTLGFPASDEKDAPGGGRENLFNGSSCGSGSVILWKSGTGAHEMQGCIYDAYLRRFGGPAGGYGYPTSDEQATEGGGGRVNYMQGTTCGSTGGSGLFWSASTPTWPVHGCIFQRYEAIGEDASGLGFPTSDEYNTSAGIRQDFSNGYILWANNTATVYVNGGSNCVTYGGFMTGPGACSGFYTTGTWFSGGGTGYLGKEIWTYANGAVKDSSAVYRFGGLGNTGRAYRVDAWVPDNHSNATHAHYVISTPGQPDANGYVHQDQLTNVWATVGYVCSTDGTAQVALWDDGGDQYPLQVGADAVRLVITGLGC